MFEQEGDARQWTYGFVRGLPPSTNIEMDGFRAQVMLAPRLSGEQTHQLPPGTPAPAWRVDDFEACPAGWGRGRERFFVPIPMGPDGKGPGMWYDWRGSDTSQYDVAVMPSTTGMNPITGMKTDMLRLERYDEKCPEHGVPFQTERFCPECKFRWPAQNYVAPPNTLWWDGFRVIGQGGKGDVRQFWFTDEVLRRDVGVAVLGGARVPAFGFAFFQAKEPRPTESWREHIPRGMMLGGGYPEYQATLGGGLKSFGTTRGGGRLESYGVGDGGAMSHTLSAGTPAIRRAAVERDVGVAAGSRIDQNLMPDPKPLSAWREEPSAVITVQFVPEDVARQILQGPRRDTIGDREGALGKLGIPLGTD
ncbi:hypothetical protein HYV74_00145 [Candidatus Uhrbacteria bacterium]|nr:hypothetical protein [Candidatus Uhrbacteria bacterium]